MSAYTDSLTGPFDCVVCLDVGCEHCQKVPEPWPAETFAMLGVRDLEQLIVDARAELMRRYRQVIA